MGCEMFDAARELARTSLHADGRGDLRRLPFLHIDNRDASLKPPSSPIARCNQPLTPAETRSCLAAVLKRNLLCRMERCATFPPLVGAWRSLVAHLPWAQGVGSSNLLAPTT